MELQDVTRVCKECGKELDINQFHKTAWGYTHVCKVCVKNKRKETKDNKARLADCEKMVEEARKARLESIPARDLMAELHRRGYDGILEYTRPVTDKIDISKIK